MNLTQLKSPILNKKHSLAHSQKGDVNQAVTDANPTDTLTKGKDVSPYTVLKPRMVKAGWRGRLVNAAQSAAVVACHMALGLALGPVGLAVVPAAIMGHVGSKMAAAGEFENLSVKEKVGLGLGGLALAGAIGVGLTGLGCIGLTAGALVGATKGGLLLACAGAGAVMGASNENRPQEGKSEEQGLAEGFKLADEAVSKS